jgi:hypothetical protein
LTPAEVALLRAASSSSLSDEIALLRVQIRRVIERAAMIASDPDAILDERSTTVQIAALIGTIIRALRTQHQLTERDDSEMDQIIATVSADLLTAPGGPRQ